MKSWLYTTCLGLLTAVAFGSAMQARANHPEGDLDLPHLKHNICVDGGYAVGRSRCFALGDDLFLVQITMNTRRLSYNVLFVDCGTSASLGLGTFWPKISDGFANQARSVALSGADNPLQELREQFSTEGLEVSIRDYIASAADCDTLREIR